MRVFGTNIGVITFPSETRSHAVHINADAWISSLWHEFYAGWCV